MSVVDIYSAKPAWTISIKLLPSLLNACPICRDEEFKTFRNKAIDREIKGFHIHCTNREKGCKWQGELNDISNHLTSNVSCWFEELQCSNECGKMIERQYLTDHVETECSRHTVNYLHCHDTGEHQFIEGKHKEGCSKLPLPCPNKCLIGIVCRKDMKAHRKECLVRKYQEQRDNEKVKEHLMMTEYRLDNAQHELSYTKEQLAAALKQITNLTFLMNTQLITMNPTPMSANIRSIHLDSMATAFGNQECPVIIKMLEYNNKKKDNIDWYSGPFYTHNNGYKCISMFVLVKMVMVKVLTCQYICI